MRVRVKIRRFNPEKDRKPYWATYTVDAEPLDRVLDVLVQIKSYQDGTLTFRRSCAHGVCGSDAMLINGRNRLACKELVKDTGRHITVEAIRGLPVIKDLVVDRSAFDRIIQAGGYVSVNTGNAPEANALPVPPHLAEKAMDAAACIGCGACVAACPNASAMLFVSAKISQLALLPQGRPEADRRALSMVRAMDACGFGNCSNHRECENACPKEIAIVNIARLNREFLHAGFVSHEM